MQPSDTPRLLDDCFLHDKDRLRHDAAIALLRERLLPIAGIEEIGLTDAAGRFAAAPTYADINIPGRDNSAVDGYAFAHAEWEKANGDFLVSTRIAAGETAPQSIGKGEAARIFTGAPMPKGADTVVMQEDCRAQDDRVFIPAGLKRGANCRLAGEDVKAGETLVHRGQALRAPELAALASTGRALVNVHAPLKIALVASGDELLRPGTPKTPEQVYDSNHYLLRGLLDRLNVEVTDFGILPDDGAIIAKTLADAASSHDAVITTGGASRGEEDHIVTALTQLGRCHMWQLAVKPGRPACFGQIGATPVFGLPGNPVAAFVCFVLYVRPSLIRLGGGEWPEPVRFPVLARFEIGKKKPDRREFLRGWLERDAAGALIAHKFDRDGSGLIAGLRAATGLIELDEDTTHVSAGEPVSFIPFSQFGIDGPAIR